MRSRDQIVIPVTQSTVAISTGDVVFSSNGDHPASIDIGWLQYDPLPRAYVIGFHDSATKLICQLETKPRVIDGWHLMPIAFLYRHYLEVMFKFMIKTGGDHGLPVPPEKELIKHGLLDLWLAAKPIVTTTWAGLGDETLEAFETIVSEFNTLDQSGQTFRYATDRKGNFPLKDVPAEISLTHVRETMDKMHAFFEDWIEAAETWGCHVS